MKVTQIQRFCMHDGPGVRTVVFLKGCPLRCSWCHNPEGQAFSQEILYDARKCIGCGACAEVCPAGAHSMAEGIHAFDRSACTGCMRCTEVCCAKALEPAAAEMTVGEILGIAARDRAFYGKDGGITLSGGEPLAHPKEVLQLLKGCREMGIGTAVETSGYFDPAVLAELVPLADIFLWDFKDGNDSRHLQHTGVSNERIRDNLLLADSMGAVSILRCIMVSGVNMQRDHYDAIAGLWGKLQNCRYVELIPYHAMGGSKMLLLGRPDNGRRDQIPTEDMMNEAREYLRGLDVRVK